MRSSSSSVTDLEFIIDCRLQAHHGTGATSIAVYGPVDFLFRIPSYGEWPLVDRYDLVIVTFVTGNFNLGCIVTVGSDLLVFITPASAPQAQP